MNNLPKDFNWIVGCFSAMSMKYADTWQFAQMVAGRFWWLCLALPVTGMLCLLGQTENTVALLTSIVCVYIIELYKI